MAHSQPTVQLADALVLFGATGDLSKRMVIPSLYFLDVDGHLPADYRIVGSARAPMTRDAFVDEVRAIMDARPEPVDEGVWNRFSQRLDYVACDATRTEGAAELKTHLKGAKRPMFFLAISPSLYGKVCAALAASGLATPESRIVLEKPIGRDLETSREVNGARSSPRSGSSASTTTWARRRCRT